MLALLEECCVTCRGSFYPDDRYRTSAIVATISDASVQRFRPRTDLPNHILSLYYWLCELKSENTYVQFREATLFASKAKINKGACGVKKIFCFLNIDFSPWGRGNDETTHTNINHCTISPFLTRLLWTLALVMKLK